MSERGYKVVMHDNFDRDTVNEYWLLTVSVSEQTAKTIAGLLNQELGSEHSSFYAMVVPAEHELQVWEP